MPTGAGIDPDPDPDFDFDNLAAMLPDREATQWPSPTSYLVLVPIPAPPFANLLASLDQGPAHRASPGREG
ncbi:MAG: hypothetical protein ACOX52_16425 [Verrucomicrobiota bacterium]